LKMFKEFLCVLLFIFIQERTNTETFFFYQTLVSDVTRKYRVVELDSLQSIKSSIFHKKKIFIISFFL